MNGREGRGPTGAIPETGLTVVFEPNNPSFDIIFIHGFTGHPEQTWTSEKANNNDGVSAAKGVDPLSKSQKILRHVPGFRIDNNKGGTIHATYWPRDLVPKTVPSARVLTYGYDTHIRHWAGRPVDKSTIYDMSGNFLVALESERRTEPSRPVVFVAHSLGGIIVKEMLRQSRSCHKVRPHLHDIFKSTIGIIFFGTPHAGADPRGFLKSIAKNVLKAVGFSVNEQIVSALLPDSERLRELRDEFGPMAQERSWIIHSFREQFGVAALSNRRVVNDASSYLNLPDIEITEQIGRNHMEMCRFTGLDDVEYKKVAAAFCRVTTLGRSLLGEEKLQELLESLRFEHIDARQTNIRKAHAQTCEWLLATPTYLKWLDPSHRDQHHGFLWIKGKPGAGKSTLMKFVLANALKTNKQINDEVIASFFFNARGDELEKSTVGMYRSLLLQLLEQLSERRGVSSSFGLGTFHGAFHIPGIEGLKALFEEVVQELGELPVTCFVDALDECDEGQIRDMISFFEEMGEMTTRANPPINFKVCFSSRYYPYITIKRGLNLALEEEHEHGEDIARYLDSRLKIGRSELADQIRTDVQQKASGIFFWVVLVTEILNKEYDHGNIPKLQQKLQDIPGNLHELFRDILIRDGRNSGELLLCVQWVLFASHPLKPEQLYFAILSGVNQKALSNKFGLGEITAADRERFILSSSKGLVEITGSTVQFIHESVRDFLLKENGLMEIWPDFEGNVEAASHERLKQCCLTYIDNATALKIAGSLPTANTERAEELYRSVNERFPLLKYATNNVLYHANAAESGGISQAGFLESFQRSDWIKLDNLFERYEVGRYEMGRHEGVRHTANASLLYILSGRDMAALIKALPSNRSFFEEEDERYGTPLFAAFATGSHGAVESFALLCSEMQPQSPLHRKCYNQFLKNRKESLEIGDEFVFSRKEGALSHIMAHQEDTLFAFFILLGRADTNDLRGQALSYAARRGHEVIVRLLLEAGHVDLDAKCKYGRTPLSWAAGGGHHVIVRLLLEAGHVDLDAKCKSGRTPLSWAAGGGHHVIVRLLLEAGHVDLDVKCKSGRTPLSWAAERGREATVQLLLQTVEIDVDSKCESGRTPLSWAAERGQEATVQLLLQSGLVNVDSRSFDGCTPLFLAARQGHEAVMRLLLQTGQADVELKEYDSGYTPLHCAAWRGHEAAVQVLLEAGKADVNAKCNDGGTPLWWAAWAWDETLALAVVRLLLQTGQVDVALKDRWGSTPLMAAMRRGNQAVVRLLKANGASLVRDVTSLDLVNKPSMVDRIN